MTEQQQAEVTAAETPEVPPIKVDPMLWCTSKVTDDRRNKSYYRKVTFGVYMYLRDEGVRHKSDQPVHWSGGALSPYAYATRALHTAMTEHGHVGRGCWPVRVKASNAYGYYSARQLYHSEQPGNEGYQYVISFAYTAVFEADKPSKILSEAECIEALGGAITVGELMAGAIERGIDTARDERAAFERARIASLMLAEYKERIEQRSLKNVRWEQRYAALVAEYKAELEIQTAELLTELGDEPGVTWSDAPDFVPDERSTVAAKAALPKAVAGEGSPAERGGFFPSGSDKMAVDIEDVR